MRRAAVLIAMLAAPALAQPAAQAPASGGGAPSVPLLLGAGEAEARIRLGEPDVARREAGGAVWTYARPSCALFLYFRPEGGRMRVTGAAAGPRRRGEAAPAVEACLAAVAGSKKTGR